ncbi:MAG: plasmid replication protein, CyRepA1 family [Pseudomonadota bacterium]
MVIDSGLGTGKTEWIKQNCFNNPEIKRSLALLPRRSLAKSMATRLGALDYEDYKATPFAQRNLIDSSKMTSVPNSLITMGFTGHERYDCIVLDEVELLIHHLHTGAGKESDRDKTINIMKGLVKNAKYVVCTQAIITPLTLDFLKDCEREDIHVVRNNHQRFKGQPVGFYGNKADCMAHINSLIYNYFNVMVPCTSSKFTQGLYKELSDNHPAKKILMVNSENANEPEQMRFLADPNGDAKNWDVNIYSPVLEQGVSIDDPHFKEVVGFCNAGEGTGTPDSFTQMIFRTRQVEHASTWVDPQTDTQPTDYKQYLAEETANFKVGAKAMEVDGKKGWFFEETDNVVMAAKCQGAAAETKNRTQEEVYAILDNMGCDINIIESPDDEGTDAGKASLKSCKDKQAEEYESQVAKALKITYPKYKDIMDSRNASLMERYQAKRFKLEDEMSINLDGLKADEKDSVFKFWNQGMAQKVINALGEAVLSAKNALAVTEYLLKNKPQNNESQGFRTRWIIRTGLLESLRIRFEDGAVVCDPDFTFTYDDLKRSYWYKWACEHKDAVNGSKLGARIKGDAPTDKALECWIRAMGIKLSSKRVDAKNSDGQKCPEVVTLDKMRAPKKRKLVRTYTVNLKAMKPLIDILERRYKAGTMPWVKTAQAQLDQNAQDKAFEDEYGLGQAGEKYPPCYSEELAPVVDNEPLPAVFNEPISPVPTQATPIKPIGIIDPNAPPPNTYSGLAGEIFGFLLEQMSRCWDVDDAKHVVGVPGLAMILGTTRAQVLNAAKVLPVRILPATQTLDEGSCIVHNLLTKVYNSS